jgi:hypothetical protein
MECKLSISSNKTWISSDVLFDFDWLMSYLNLVFEGLFWIDDDESITGYLWGIPRFKIEVIAKPIEVEIPKKGGVGRPVGSGRVDHIVAGMKKEIKERIKNGELSARQISQMFDLSFPSSQKIIKRIQER